MEIVREPYIYEPSQHAPASANRLESIFKPFFLFLSFSCALLALSNTGQIDRYYTDQGDEHRGRPISVARPGLSLKNDALNGQA